MNDFPDNLFDNLFDNPFDIPNINNDDIPVLNDIVSKADTAEAEARPDTTIIDNSQLGPIIEQIAMKVQHELDPRIEETVQQILKNSLDNPTQQHSEYIRKSINILLKEQFTNALKAVTDSHQQKIK